MENQAENKPIPTPRPRQSHFVENENVKKTSVYENYTISEEKLANFSQDASFSSDIERSQPVPAPRTKSNIPATVPLNNLNDNSTPAQSHKSTGAIRKIPNIKNNLESEYDYKSQNDTDDISQSSSTSAKSSNDQRFQTPSPSHIMKSIGNSSRMLRESIGERISEKTSSAKHKITKEFKNTKQAMDSWKNDGKFGLKNLTSKIDSFSLKRNNKKKSKKRSASIDETDNHSNSLNDGEFLDSLSFKSPINDSSTYEVPKSHRSNGDLPSYEDVVKESFSPRENIFYRSLNVIQSKIEKVNKKVPENSDESSDDEYNMSQPPKMPPPELPEQIYGKIKKIQSSDYENAPMIPLRKNLTTPNSSDKVSSTPSNVASDKATCDSDQSLDENFVIGKTLNKREVGIDRSESWRFCDRTDSRQSLDSDESNEPIYANENSKIEMMYGQVVKKKSETEILKPIELMNSNESQQANRKTLTSEILREFDPLSRESFDAYIMTRMNHLSLLDTLLGEETYGTVEHYLDEAKMSSKNDLDNPPMPPTRFDSLVDETDKAAVHHHVEPSPLPKPPTRKKKNIAERQNSVIIHQNLRLRDDSIENLVDPYLAKVDEPSTSSSSSATTNYEVDLSRVVGNDKKTTTSTTNWFVENEDESKFVKNNLDNPNINTTQKSHDKVSKTVQLTKVNNLTPQNLYPILPTYEESKNDEVVSPFSNNNVSSIIASNNNNDIILSEKEVSKSRSFFNFGLKRNKENKVDVANFIPRAPLTDVYPLNTDKSVILFKLPSGVIEDMLKELNPRFVEINKRHFKAYSDSDFKILKEHLDLSYLTSIQFLVNHKFAEFKTEAGRQIYCFELNLSVPKVNSSSSSVAADLKNGVVKTQRVTYVYGIHSKNEKCVWMQKIIRFVTDVFPKEYTSDFVRAGWCYVKKSISQQWCSTWVMISRRKLLFYDFSEARLEILDLRKARYVGLKDSDESINQLFVEKGPTIFIDCPPYTCYFIMCNSRETKIWSAVCIDEAHANGNQLRHQQLTKNNVPVFIDKCINFIYTNGTMSEGIYRKAGSSTNIQKLIMALKKDAFSVQITRSDYNEHDVSSALKRFLRDLPEPLMGKLAVSFLSVSEMNDSEEKVRAYKELLQRLPSVEYQTLKKLLGHLHFIQTQSSVNKMKSENLAMVFGPTLMQPNNNENQFQMDSRDAGVVSELIMNYKKLYNLTPDEVKTEQIMLQVLQKYHSAAENLSDAVKKSGDFKIWITLDPSPELSLKQEDKKQINLIVTPLKTVYELCKEMESQMGMPAYQMTLMEVILNGDLQRPVHYNEKVLNIVLRWANWPEDDRKTNYLELRPKTKFQEQVERSMKQLSSFTPCMEMKFADRKTKSMKQFTLELCDTSLNVLKAEKQGNVKVKDVDISNCIAYIGAEKKRDSSMRWALTFIELNFQKRSREMPFIGHIIAGNNINDQVTWYSSILYSIHGYDISPNPEIVIP